MVRFLALALRLAAFASSTACTREEPPGEPDGKELPQPSGPPVVQQVEPEQDKPTVDDAASGWRSVGGGLALVDAGKTILTIRCEGGKLIVHAPAFSPIGSEDRFAFGLGDEPVTMVADPTLQPGPGVTAEGPVPENFAAWWRSADRITALYGTQRVGPHPVPPAAVADAFLESCG